tara:strand:- start:165 stop:710 length:546 start_codon:yes stop_codon:yes gene_type:complete
MKPWHFRKFQQVMDEVQPRTIAEIGTHDGRTAIQMANYALHISSNDVEYTGYDAFGAITPSESLNAEINGKGLGSKNEAIRWLNKAKKRSAGRFNYTLIEGFTSDTLLAPKAYDFIYIDGGHSYETVKHDYTMVKNSRAIIFDDWYIPEVGQLLKELESEHDIEYVELSDDSRQVAILRNY